MHALLALAALVLLAGCNQPPLETPEEARARRAADCRAMGFEPDSAELRLCLLLQQANERLEVLERRLSRIETDVRFVDPFPYRRGWW